jgi:hypothetical protein
MQRAGRKAQTAPNCSAIFWERLETMQTLKTSRKFRLSLAALAVGQALAFSIGAEAAQSDGERISELEKKLEKSLALIEQLSTRLGSVEGVKASPAAPTSEKSVQQEARIEQLEKSIQQVAETAATRRELGIPLHGFADVGYLHSSNDPNNKKGGFALGNLDLYLTPQFGDRVKSIVELVFEFGPESSAMGSDMERVQFGYTFSDALTLWVGRFHTPYGYWNTAFHHGQQIQTAASRPRFVDFEDKGGFLPAHAVGLLASGGTRVGDGRLQYDAYVANGNRLSDGVLDFNAFKDDNANKLVGGNLRYSFGGALDGLTVGSHAFTEQVGEYDAGQVLIHNTKVNMAGGFAVYDSGNWEVISEYYRFSNKDLFAGGANHRSWAAFAQASYALDDRWIPYARIEKASLDPLDNYFLGQSSGLSYKRGVLGLRFNLNTQSALKLELNRTEEEERDLSKRKSNEVGLQFAVRF